MSLFGAARTANNHVCSSVVEHNCLWVFLLYLFWDLFASFHAEAQQRWPDLDSPLLQVLDALYPLPRVVHHLGKEVGEAGSAELGGPSPVQWAVVDGLSVGRVAQAGQLLAGAAAAAALIWRYVGHISRKKKKGGDIRKQEDIATQGLGVCVVGSDRGCCGDVAVRSIR